MLLFLLTYHTDFPGFPRTAPMTDDKKLQTVKIGEEEVEISNQTKASFWGRLWDTA